MPADMFSLNPNKWLFEEMLRYPQQCTMESSTVELFHVLFKDMTIQKIWPIMRLLHTDCFRTHRKEYLLRNHSNVDVGDLGLIPGLESSPGWGKGYPLQYFGLENSMDYSPWGHKKLNTAEWLSLHFTSSLVLLVNCVNLGKFLPNLELWVPLLCNWHHNITLQSCYEKQVRSYEILTAIPGTSYKYWQCSSASTPSGWIQDPESFFAKGVFTRGRYFLTVFYC